jgi:AraC-like DNA-binding protein
MNWILFLSLLSIHDLAFLSVGILRKRFHTDANKYIFYVLLVFIEIIIFNVLIYRGLLAMYPFLFFINYTFIFTVPSHFLTIVNILLGKENGTGLKKKLIHFIPSVISLTFLIWFYFQPADFKYHFFIQLEEGNKPWFVIALDFIFILQIVIYLSICHNKIYTFRKANPDNGNGKRLWRFINFLVFISASIFIPVFISFFSVTTTLFCCSVSSIVFYDLFSYQSIKNSSISTEKIVIKQPDTLPPVTLQSVVSQPAVSSSVPNLSDEAKQKLTLIITRLMEEEKYFQDSTISLNSLADRCNTPKYLLTLYLNQYHVNFYDFINRYRIEEAKKILTSSEGYKYNIEVISEKCGFKSRSVFYTAFKKYTGVTPIQFIKNSKINDSAI